MAARRNSMGRGGGSPAVGSINSFRRGSSGGKDPFPALAAAGLGLVVTLPTGGGASPSRPSSRHQTPSGSKGRKRASQLGGLEIDLTNAPHTLLRDATVPTTPGGLIPMLDHHRPQTSDVGDTPGKRTTGRRASAAEARRESVQQQSRRASLMQHAFVSSYHSEGGYVFQSSRMSVRDHDSDAGSASEEEQQATPIDQIIHQSSLFKDCDYNFVEELVMQMRNIVVRAHQVVAREGKSEPAESMFFVLCGEVHVVQMGKVCKRLREGATFGEAMLLGAVREWKTSYVVHTQGIICELSRDVLLEVLERFPREAERFKKIEERLAAKATSQREERDSIAASAAALRHAASLRDVGDAFLRDLDAVMDRRLFFPGDVVFAEGSQECAMYVMDRGSMQVKIAGRLVRCPTNPRVSIKHSEGEEIASLKKLYVTGEYGETDKAFEDQGDFQEGELNHLSEQVRTNGNLPHACIVGEEALLGILPHHTRTVVAASTCDVRVLYRPAMLKILERHPAEHQHLHRYMHCERAMAFPPMDPFEITALCGLGCSEEFLHFLASNVDERMVCPGEAVVMDDLQVNLSTWPQSSSAAGFSVCKINHGRLLVIQYPAETQGTRQAFARSNTPGRIQAVRELGAGDKVPLLLASEGKGIVAMEVSFISILHRVVVAKAMEQYSVEREILMPLLVGDAHKSPTGGKAGNVANTLRERSIFANASAAFLDEIVNYGEIRVFMPGDRIIEQDTDGRSMFILWVGVANVVKETLEDADKSNPVRSMTNVGALTHGSVFGELVMLGVQSRRTASIIAATVCCTWEVEQEAILAILDRHPSERTNFLNLVEEHLSQLAAPQLIHHPVFSRFHQQFRTLLAVNCERKLYFPGQTVVRENTQGDRMYIMNLGLGQLEIGGQYVMPVRSGAHFGLSMISLKDSKERFPASLVTKTMCQVLVITKATFVHAVHKYPEMRDAARAMEKEERQSAMKLRTTFARMVQRRRGLRCILDALMGNTAAKASTAAGTSPSQALEGNGSASGETNELANLLELAFEAWREITDRHLAERKAEEEFRAGNEKRINEWLDKRRRLLEKVQPKAELKVLVDLNLSRRGPLVMAKKPAAEAGRSGEKICGLSKTFLESCAESPYMAPAPVWRHRAWLERQRTTRLPPVLQSLSVERLARGPAPKTARGQKGQQQDLEGSLSSRPSTRGGRGDAAGGVADGVAGEVASGGLQRLPERSAPPRSPSQDGFSDSTASTPRAAGEATAMDAQNAEMLAQLSGSMRASFKVYDTEAAQA
eukprot:TRINITY_DN30918_c0_g1_i1.p1 TRINITY_DN30918_c0_g1~~TRINITY_DN30918_c0_g1_i1.p1  ORF type:complete len:1280 (+),score=328.89 TRINITY_DN30918_c0_g1_i1:250-4089(+)